MIHMVSLPALHRPQLPDWIILSHSVLKGAKDLGEKAGGTIYRNRVWKMKTRNLA